MFNQKIRKPLALSATILLSAISLSACSNGEQVPWSLGISDDQGGSIEESTLDGSEEAEVSQGGDEQDNDINSSTEEASSNPDALDDPILRALQTGNPVFLPAPRLSIENELITRVEDLAEDQNSVVEHIYGNLAVDYQPGRSSSFVKPLGFADSFPLVAGVGGHSLARATDQDDQRRAAFGTNLLRALQEGKLGQYDTAATKLLEWLIGDAALSGAESSASIRFAFVDDTSFTRSRDWILSHFPSWQIERCGANGNENESLNRCLTESVDLVITGSRQDGHDSSSIRRAFDELKRLKTPLLYVHVHGWNTSSMTQILMSYFNVAMPSPGNAGNYWAQDYGQWSNASQMLASASELPKLSALVKHFRDDSFSISLSACVHTSSGWGSDCSATPSFDGEFQQIVSSIKSSLSQFDAKGEDLFAKEGFDIEKLLVLLGDHYRQSIRYPMDKNTTSSGEFLRALYADSVVYNSRRHNPVQFDLGNFSRTDFSHVQTTSKTIDYTSKPHFRSAGVYALPGQTFTVSRLDRSNLSTKVFINSLRPQSTQIFGNKGYKRPKYLRSVSIDLPPGESRTITSPYGGPIQVAFSANELPVTIRFEGIGEHPYWNGPEDDASFDIALARGDFDWAEVVTPGFEVHSTLEKMRKTVEDPNWSSGALLAEATTQYLHNYPHVLAGFKGPGLDVVPEIHDFADANGFSVPHIDIVKHMNADQPSCGGGCSGNPYDAGWAFSPTGHGDIHELGHGLEKGRLKFEGREGHATTNFYSYFSKSRFEDEYAQPASCQSLPFEDMFNRLVDSRAQLDPYAYMQSQSSYMNRWNTGVALMIQVMMSIQKNSNTLSDAWYLIPRLHLINREFDSARKTDDNWLSKRDSLGFSGVSRSGANMLQNNDFLLVAIAQASQMDFSAFFRMWGLRVSSSIETLVSSKGFDEAPLEFYAPSSANAYCSSLEAPAVGVSASAQWPH